MTLQYESPRDTPTATASSLLLLLLALGGGFLGLYQLLFPAGQAGEIWWQRRSSLVLITCAGLIDWAAWRATARAGHGRFWRRLLVGGVATYALTVATFGGELQAPHVLRIAVACWAALLACAWALGWRLPAPLARAASPIGLAMANVALFLVLAELGLRVYAAWSGHSLLVRQSVDAFRLEPNRFYGRLLTNSQGYPSREFELERRPGVQRIAILGDSFAVGMVRQDVNFASWIERLRPNTEVYNFGITGSGTREYYEILTSEALRYRPDIVLLSFFIGNDVTDSRPLPSLRLLDPQAHHLVVFIRRTWRLAREWRRKREEASELLPRDQYFKHPPRLMTGMTLSRETHLQNELERLMLCRPSSAGWFVEAWEYSLGHLARIEAACRAARMRLLMVLIPDEYQVNSALLDEVLRYGKLELGELDLDLPQKRLREFLGRRGIAYLDLKPAFAAVPDTYLPRDTHWNEKGNLLAAKEIVAWLDRVAPALSPASSGQVEIDKSSQDSLQDSLSENAFHHD